MALATNFPRAAVEIIKKVSENFSMDILKKLVFGELHAKVEEVDDLENTSSSGTEIIEWKDEARPTVVDEMEWRGLSNQATVYRQRGTKLSPPESCLSNGVRFFFVEEEGEVVRISMDEDTEGGNINDVDSSLENI